MVARLGNVLYWLGCAAATATFAIGVGIWVTDNPSNHPGTYFLVILLLACVPWIIGRACRYVLAGT
ncbi:MAG TPA: hypothetical protein VFA65_24590 [Bryobacteraceae bacterium]|nr:hypothetical protein [Bryobacteraceae bacterium]